MAKNEIFDIVKAFNTLESKLKLGIFVAVLGCFEKYLFLERFG